MSLVFDVSKLTSLLSVIMTVISKKTPPSQPRPLGLLTGQPCFTNHSLLEMRSICGEVRSSPGDILKWHLIHSQYNHHRYVVPDLFHLPEGKSSSHFPCPPPPPGATAPPLSLWIYLFWTFNINEFIQYVTLCVCLLSPSIMFWRFIHGVT